MILTSTSVQILSKQQTHESSRQRMTATPVFKSGVVCTPPRTIFLLHTRKGRCLRRSKLGRGSRISIPNLLDNSLKFLISSPCFYLYYEESRSSSNGLCSVLHIRCLIAQHRGALPDNNTVHLFLYQWNYSTNFDYYRFYDFCYLKIPTNAKITSGYSPSAPSFPVASWVNDSSWMVDWSLQSQHKAAPSAETIAMEYDPVNVYIGTLLPLVLLFLRLAIFCRLVYFPFSCLSPDPPKMRTYAPTNLTTGRRYTYLFDQNFNGTHTTHRPRIFNPPVCSGNILPANKHHLRLPQAACPSFWDFWVCGRFLHLL